MLKYVLYLISASPSVDVFFCRVNNMSAPESLLYELGAPVEETSSPEPSAPSPAASTPSPVPAASPASSLPTATIEDVPIKAIDVLTVIIAQKLKKKVDEVPLSKSIKDLVGGKSTPQNKILGDLQLEFTSAPEKGEELPLEELGSALGVGFGGSLGKYSNGLISRVVGG
jgi:fatty acid synthase subunit alpha, fungi type